MSRFNTGDKVKVISLGSKSQGYGVNIGMVGEVVVEYNHDCECVGVKFDHKIDGHSLLYRGTEALGYGATNGLWIEPENLKFIEEEKQMEPQFKNMKIRIKDKEHSRLVQEALFEMGYKWGGQYQDQCLRFTDKAFLYAECDGMLLHGYSAENFDTNEAEEVELVTAHSFKVVDQEAKRKAAEKEALQKNVAEMQKQLDEMKQKLENMT
jgi:hypothetical protein